MPVNRTLPGMILALSLLALTQTVFALDAIDTQYGPNGIPVYLLKAKVDNGVLSVAIMYDNNLENLLFMERPSLKEIYYIAGSKKYPVLKDANGNWLASPVYGDKLFRGIDEFDIQDGEKIVAWFKFPAPPEGTKSIEISVPGVTPFTADIGQQ